MSVGSKRPDATATQRYGFGSGNAEALPAVPVGEGVTPMLDVVLVESDEGGAGVLPAGSGCGEGVDVAARRPQADSRIAHASKPATAFMRVRVMGRLKCFIREEPERAPP